jgi:multicomponent Na+:H+ antiporter subunit A
LYFLFAGHNGSGGGFVGCLCAGAAISLRYVAGGVDDVRTSFRFSPWTILGSGLTLAVGTALVPLLVGQNVLEHDSAVFHVPLLGDLHIGSTLSFDGGVYLIVIGLVLMVFEAFGDDGDGSDDGDGGEDDGVDDDREPDSAVTAEASVVSEVGEVGSVAR